MFKYCMRRLSTIQFFVALIALPLCGCLRDTGSTTPISIGTVPYVMAPLDSARIITREGTLREIQIGQDGRVDLPNGSRLVQGLPIADFRALLLSAYPGARGIKITEFRTNRVTVLGEVFHQIHTDLSEGPMRVMDAIASANGFTPLANKRRVRLVRQNAGTVVVYELDLRDLMKGSHLDQNFLLEPGDVITVPRNFL